MYSEMGHMDESLACLERACAIDPRDFPSRLALAQALLRLGQIDDAELHLHWCLTRCPEHPNVRVALRSIARQRLATRAANDNSVKRASYSSIE